MNVFVRINGLEFIVVVTLVFRNLSTKCLKLISGGTVHTTSLIYLLNYLFIHSFVCSYTFIHLFIHLFYFLFYFIYFFGGFTGRSVTVVFISLWSECSTLIH